MKNQIQLITYVDRVGCKTILDLKGLLENELKNLFGGVHLLPFFFPIDGSDAGFDPIDHKQVDPRLGDWNAIRELSTTTDVMADLIVNHMSADSPEFKDYLEKGEASAYAKLFLSLNTVFPNGASEEELSTIYRPRPGSPFTKFSFADGSEKLIWTTFTANQIDIDVYAKEGAAYLESILALFQQAGIKMIRLDAAGYAIKKQGTSCFMIPETFAFIDQLTQKAQKHGIEVLVEIHSFYKTQIQIAEKVDYVYDFALPVLVLDTLFNANATNLKNWLKIAPRNVITVLDTHDGIGVVDVASEGAQKGLIPDDSLNAIVDKMHENSGGKSRKATGAAASNLDLYQVNCTYFEALGSNIKAYLIARCIQFFVPGIPQVYYVGVFGDENDMDLLAATNVGRDINRHYYTRDEIQQKIKSPLFKELKHLMQLRNTHAAFNGEFQLVDTEEYRIAIKWQKDSDWISMNANLKTQELTIEGTASGTQTLPIKL